MFPFKQLAGLTAIWKIATTLYLIPISFYLNKEGYKWGNNILDLRRREFTKNELDKQIQEKPRRYRKKCDIALLYKKQPREMRMAEYYVLLQLSS